MPNLIAVTGASGVVGGHVARQLAQRHVPLRLVVRDPARAPALDGTEVRAASGYGDAEAMRDALEGVHTLFLVPAHESDDRVEQHRTAVDAAVAAGVRRIVYLSAVGAAPDSTFLLARDHWATERHILASGVPATFARMSLYLDFVPQLAGGDGRIAGPGGDGRLAAVSRADVAEAVTALLTDARGAPERFDLTGGEARTLAELAAELAAWSGKDIAYVEQTVPEARASRASLGAPDWLLDAWVSTYTAIARGEFAAVSDGVRRLTGHAPATLADFLRGHPDALEHVA